MAIGEFAGWPMLGEPLQTLLAKTLGRTVQFTEGGDFQVRLLGGLRLHAARLEIGAPDWSKAPHLLRAEGVDLDLRYIDLWRARQGQRLRVSRLTADVLDAHLERDVQGRVSWQFGQAPEPVADGVPLLPVFGGLRLGAGVLHYRDVPGLADLRADVSWTPDAADAGPLRGELHVKATGSLRRLPLKAELRAWGVEPASASGPAQQAVPLALTLRLGRAEIGFKGLAGDPLRFDGVVGRFELSGPSLAAVGDAVGVTLPTTAAFHSEGALRRDGQHWHALVERASIGGSRMGGDFQYDAGRSPPRLSGRLAGDRLLLVDLGPVLGTTSAATAQIILPAAAAVVFSAASAPPLLVAATRGPGKVLPNRPFDLAALRVMDADVQVDIAEVDLNSTLLEPLQPLRGHLQLRGGILTLSDLDARTAQGRLQGDMSLDGQGPLASWKAVLQWDGVRLERWLRQQGNTKAQPFVSGRLSGRAKVSGQGRSTAEILASLRGTARTELQEGAVSHLLIEAAGLDLAQGLGVLLKGDDALAVNCGVADLVAEGGVFRSRVVVLDTVDSAVWIDGTVSLASESLDLRAVVSPKDFSPLAFRAPLRLQGPLTQPRLSVETGALGRKLAASVLLGLINPLAALFPLIDAGQSANAGTATAGCQALVSASTASRITR